MLKLLFIGDIVGKPGRRVVEKSVAAFREAEGIDFVVANGENAAGGSGINARLSEEILAAGVDAITLGDHVWDQRGFDQELPKLERVCRPANLPRQCPGRTSLIIEKNGFRLGIFTVIGRQYLNLKGDCPFQVSDEMLKELKDQTDGVFVEIHAEATSEKIAMGWYLDGRALAVAGTHTHVPTADACVLPRGTAYLTDAGMTGPYNSVIGRAVPPVLGRFLDGLPRRFEVAEGDVRLSGCLIEFDPKGFCVSNRLVTLHEKDYEVAAAGES